MKVIFLVATEWRTINGRLECYGGHYTTDRDLARSWYEGEASYSFDTELIYEVIPESLTDPEWLNDEPRLDAIYTAQAVIDCIKSGYSWDMIPACYASAVKADEESGVTYE